LRGRVTEILKGEKGFGYQSGEKKGGRSADAEQNMKRGEKVEERTEEEEGDQIAEQVRRNCPGCREEVGVGRRCLNRSGVTRLEGRELRGGRCRSAYSGET